MARRPTSSSPSGKTKRSALPRPTRRAASGASPKKGASTRGNGSSNGSASRSSRQIGYAVVGLGHIAQVAVLPAFAHAKENSKLTALVSDDREKLEKLGRKYGVPKDALYSYDDYDACLKREDVDAVYIALPNHLHREYTTRAAEAGVNVLCEKPMALSVEECDAMIRACRGADVRLMIAYRLHFDPANLETLKLVQDGKLGEARLFESSFGFEVQEGNIRVQAAKGGGPIWDIGIYCINGARMLFQDEPTEVFAFSAARPDARFAEVPEAVNVVMKFPQDRLATFQCSFGITSFGAFRVFGTKGLVELKSAYTYAGETHQSLLIGGKEKSKKFPATDQFAPELLEFSRCVLEGSEPEPDGVEGKADIRIIEAIHRSLEEGRPIRLEFDEHPRHPQPEQAIRVPPVVEPDTIHVEAPHQ